MDKTRLRASLKLIQLLLRCPSGEEFALLQSHASLIDADFIQLMEQAADYLAADDQRKTADFLGDLATQLREAFTKATKMKWVNANQRVSVAIADKPVASLRNGTGNGKHQPLSRTVSVRDSSQKMAQPHSVAIAPKKREKETRAQAYLQLIEELLRCRRGEEAQILQTNRDLVDVGLVKMIAQVAAVLAERGNRNSADFLVHVARPLVLVLGVSPSTLASSPLPNSDTQVYFLWQLLQTTAEKPNLRVLYPPLAAKLEHLHEYLTTQWQDLTTVLLSNRNNSAEAEQLAKVIGNFNQLSKNFSHGNRAKNLEFTLIGYEIITTFLSRKTSPEVWAKTQNQLGNAYISCLREEKDSLECAINCYHQALLVHTHEAFPEDWAMIQNHLGYAYSIRVQGERAENLELAINCYHQALRVYTHEASPELWANIQNHLGSVYLERIRGDKAENLELAIYCFQQALQVYSLEEFPEQWAMTLNHLGLSYRKRLRGEKAENSELAISCFHQALQVYLQAIFPEQWAMVQSNLGLSYRKRLHGEKAENLEQAINCFHQALQVYTLDTFPEQWAITQNYLGEVYRKRLRGERAENLELAISCFQQALQVYTQDTFLEKWAMTQHNLGIAYSLRLRGEKAENLELASNCFNQALLGKRPRRSHKKMGNGMHSLE